ncbi:diguanylate cyclase (GGDEF) domain-containing protein [Pseudomonas linyingensis]|uniref:diguanylate cyclase n=1 Tax=Pseudomonas linyingensis TaxID=915471 RepID=A0A1H6VNH4_9PSED|nr:PleD family two-component system response regulator [Pseudomonas linyingensis]SEJ04604.1 diguanylate cyclase (GGDEF) domain-containing protein [Pseudomonas linyingensis]
MTEHAELSSDRLKQHFAQRVLHQARQVLELWQRLQHSAWSSVYRDELLAANQRLGQCAERFQQPLHAQLASAIEQCLQAVEANRGRLNSALIGELDSLMQRLARSGLRQGDGSDPGILSLLRKPIYLALLDGERSERLARQLEFFGFTALPLDSAEAFRKALRQRHPAAIVMEVDFAGNGGGLQLAEEAQQGLEHKLPVLFFSEQEADTRTRLAAVRAGGEDFFSGSLDASTLLERLEDLTRLTQTEPYKVLIVDDSRAQTTFTERMLNSAGIITRSLTDPIQVMAALGDFQPDLIILDMYMPECLGTELAKVIRHHERYVSVPIIYLSAEDDIDKQLDAMGEGGDDFLTKPIQARHLIATVRNRAARARNLKARMVRDSLTGLYNHTHILQLLEDARVRARRDQQPLSFAMLDIDHFKQVNDRYGHPMGDRVIKSLALFLKQRLRKSDHIGRYGGEEFAVVLPDTDAATAARVLDDIRRRFAEIHFPAQPQDLSCSFSCGIAELHGEQEAKALASHADEALYRAKHAGRNRVETFTSSLRHLHEALA